jgi:hypothetical protein
MMKKFLAALVPCLLLPAVPAFAQTAAQMDALLDAPRVSFGQAAALMLPAAGLLSPEAGGEAAFVHAKGWLPRRAERDSPIRMRELSYLIMRSFGLSGGFMYALFPGPRYAYRALAWRRLLPLNADPGRFLTGEELLYVTGRVLALAGEGEVLADVLPDVPADAAAAEATVEGEPTTFQVEQGQGLSTGAEGALHYAGEFEVE